MPVRTIITLAMRTGQIPSAYRVRSVLCWLICGIIPTALEIYSVGSEGHSMETIRVGQSALRVSEIGLGTASIGTFYSDVSEVQAVETVHFALENGVNF